MAAIQKMPVAGWVAQTLLYVLHILLNKETSKYTIQSTNVKNVHKRNLSGEN